MSYESRGPNGGASSTAPPRAKRSSKPPASLRALEGVRVSIGDTSATLRRDLGQALEALGAFVSTYGDALALVESLRTEHPDVVVLENAFAPTNVDALRALRSGHVNAEVVVIASDATVEGAVAAMKLGAFDFLRRDTATPLAIADTVSDAWKMRSLKQAIPALVDGQTSAVPAAGLLGNDPSMRRVRHLIESVARWSATVLVTGESGTGKELVARAIHEASPRADAPFIALNCGAMPEALVEAELFGYAKGAFTGAATSREGLFQAANGGTLFLDEIGELALPLQAKLLRVLQESEVRRVGSNVAEKIDVRLVAATNVDLSRARTEGRFREDLYYRLDVVAIHLPPLRDRRDDIPLLAQHFVRKHAARMGKDVQYIHKGALDILNTEQWPGNVRQLENVLERAVILCHSNIIESGDLSGLTQASSDESRVVSAVADLSMAAARKMAMMSFDRRYLEERLIRSKGNVSEAARMADMDRANFRRLLKKYGLEPKLYGESDER